MHKADHENEHLGQRRVDGGREVVNSRPDLRERVRKTFQATQGRGEEDGSVGRSVTGERWGESTPLGGLRRRRLFVT